MRGKEITVALVRVGEPPEFVTVRDHEIFSLLPGVKVEVVRVLESNQVVCLCDEDAGIRRDPPPRNRTVFGTSGAQDILGDFVLCRWRPGWRFKSIILAEVEAVLKPGRRKLNQLTRKAGTDTRKWLVHLREKAEFIASRLIRASKWFTLTPYPDDYWLFEVKNEPTGLPVELVTGEEIPT